MKPLSLLLLSSLTLVGCGANKNQSNNPVTGITTSADMSTLEAGAQIIKDRPPGDAISAYLDGFHFLAVIKMARWKPIIM